MQLFCGMKAPLIVSWFGEKNPPALNLQQEHVGTKRKGSPQDKAKTAGAEKKLKVNETSSRGEHLVRRFGGGHAAEKKMDVRSRGKRALADISGTSQASVESVRAQNKSPVSSEKRRGLAQTNWRNRKGRKMY